MYVVLGLKIEVLLSTLSKKRAPASRRGLIKSRYVGICCWVGVTNIVTHNLSLVICGQKDRRTNLVLARNVRSRLRGRSLSSTIASTSEHKKSGRYALSSATFFSLVRQCTCQPSHLAIELSRLEPPDRAEACCLATPSRKSRSLSVECEDTRRRLI